MLFTCQAGFESLLGRELTERHAGLATEKGPGWVRVASASETLRTLSTLPSVEAEAQVGPPLAFAHLSLLDPVEIQGDSVNAIASLVAEFFLTSLRHERIDSAWPSIWLGPSELVGLGRRISGVEQAFGEQLKRKLSRVAKLATGELPRGVVETPVRGLFVFFVDFGRAFVTRQALVHGPRRMADDPLAPSRSYLKVEEAYVVLGREPQSGETVCDLGAAPGGWSYSAAKRGARVLAIDNGPMKGGALNHPRIEHRMEDAFRFSPSEEATEAMNRAGFDWLFCDMVEDPHHVMRHIIEPWLSRGWCRRFVINLKFGRVDPIGLLGELRSGASPFVKHTSRVRIQHLYHDREEFTVIGEIRS